MSEKLTELEARLYGLGISCNAEGETIYGTLYVEEFEPEDSPNDGQVNPHFLAMKSLERKGLVQQIGFVNGHTVWQRTDAKEENERNG